VWPVCSGSVDKDGLEDIVVDYKPHMADDLEKGSDPFLKRVQEKKERVELNKKQNQVSHQPLKTDSMAAVHVSAFSDGECHTMYSPTATRVRLADSASVRFSKITVVR
jgi:hypothetical protein